MRISVIGSSGSGKTSFARQLGQALGLPVIELDAINWQAGWRDLSTHDPEAFARRVEEATLGEAWVIDGNYSRLALPRVWRRASDVVWLDYGRWLVMNRVIRRSIARAVSGEELWPGTGNTESWRRWLDKEHPIRWAWDTFDVRRNRLEEAFADPRLARLAVHRLRRTRDAAALVDRLAQQARSERS